MTTVYLRLYPLNEGQELNYVHSDRFYLKSLLHTCGKMQRDLQNALPRATITIKIESQDCTKEWFYDAGRITDSEGNPLQFNNLLAV